FKSVVLILVSIFCVSGVFSQSKFNVLDFGAFGDGKRDDTKAINDCIIEALRHGNSVVMFPSGVYLCNGGVRINMDIQTLELRGEVKNELPPVLVFANKDISRGVSVVGKQSKKSTGSFTIKNIHLKGSIMGTGKDNIFYNTVRHQYGLGIQNIANVSIERCVVEDFYGNGIDVSNKLTRFREETSSFKHVVIKNCQIINCWGKSPTDSYGDGIQIADCNNFILVNNVIDNIVKISEEHGRAGIVVEDY